MPLARSKADTTGIVAGMSRRRRRLASPEIIRSIGMASLPERRRETRLAAPPSERSLNGSALAAAFLIPKSGLSHAAPLRVSLRRIVAFRSFQGNFFVTFAE